MSDLTELAALAEQSPLERKSRRAGRNVRGHRARIQKRARHNFRLCADDPSAKRSRGELRENSERILEQTRALTHVVTEFLRFAKPLELSYETLPMRIAGRTRRRRNSGSRPRLRHPHSGDFCDVPGDEGLLRQALLNSDAQCRRSRCAAAARKAASISPARFEDRAGRKWQRISRRR